MSQRVIVLHGDTSERTHEPDCTWALAQERNANIRWHRRDSDKPADADWFAERRAERAYRQAIGRPLPHCTYCNCAV
jgi:hypothetical protein